MFTSCSGGKGEAKSVEDLFDLVVETTGDEEKGRYRSTHWVSIMCAKQLLLDYNIRLLSYYLLQ